MTYNILAFLMLSILALVLAGAAGRRIRWVSPRLLMAAVLLRIVGSTARYEVMERFYRGVGDAVDYYRNGLGFAEHVWAFDSASYHPMSGSRGRWWGTQFLRNISGLAVSVVGPSLRAEFLLFSLVSFCRPLRFCARVIGACTPGPVPRDTQHCCGCGRRCGSGRRAWVRKPSSFSVWGSPFWVSWGAKGVQRGG